MHLLQPSSNLQLSRKTPDAVLKHALRVIRNGYGFPSIFNADAVIEEQMRQGKTLEDARAGGCSGCVETGAFGKEAYILTGYFNLVKVLELALHDGVDPRTGSQLGPATGPPSALESFDDLFAAFRRQLHHFVEVKVRGNQIIEQMYARLMPAPLLSVLTDDCIRRGRDYNAGGARYNHTFIQFVGIGSLTDSLAALKRQVFDERQLALEAFVRILDTDFEGHETLRQRLLHRMAKYGNDDDFADRIMVRAFNACFHGSGWAAEHERGPLPDRDATDDQPRVFRLGHRGDTRWTHSPACRCPRGSLPFKGRPAGAHRRNQVRRQDGPPQDRRHSAEHEVLARAVG